MLEDVLLITATQKMERWVGGQHINRVQRNVVLSRAWYAILYDPNNDLKMCRNMDDSIRQKQRRRRSSSKPSCARVLLDVESVLQRDVGKQKDVSLPTNFHGRVSGRRREGTMLQQVSTTCRSTTCGVSFCNMHFSMTSTNPSSRQSSPARKQSTKRASKRKTCEHDTQKSWWE